MLRRSDFSDRSEVIKAVPAARWMAKREGMDLSLIKGAGPDGIILMKDIENFKVTQGAMERTKRTEKIYASSLARKLADKKGVSLEMIEGLALEEGS